MKRMNYNYKVCTIVEVDKIKVYRMKNRTEKFVFTLPDGEMLNLSNIAETVIIKSSRDGHLGRHLVPFHHSTVTHDELKYVNVHPSLLLLDQCSVYGGT